MICNHRIYSHEIWHWPVLPIFIQPFQLCLKSKCNSLNVDRYDFLLFIVCTWVSVHLEGKNSLTKDVQNNFFFSNKIFHTLYNFSDGETKVTNCNLLKMKNVTHYTFLDDRKINMLLDNWTEVGYTPKPLWIKHTI